MSSKSKFKGTKVELPPVPREIDVLQAEAQKAMGELAQVTYQAYLFDSRAAELNELILALNKEAAARNELNAKKAAETPTAPETKEGTDVNA